MWWGKKSKQAWHVVSPVNTGNYHETLGETTNCLVHVSLVRLTSLRPRGSLSVCKMSLGGATGSAEGTGDLSAGASSAPE